MDSLLDPLPFFLGKRVIDVYVSKDTTNTLWEGVGEKKMSAAKNQFIHSIIYALFTQQTERTRRMWPLLLFLFAATINAAQRHCRPLDESSECSESTHSLSFNRIDMTTDAHRHVSIKVYAFSEASTIMNTLLLFRSPYYQMNLTNDTESYHNALLIGASVYPQYQPITRNSRFSYNNEIPLLSQATQFMMPYNVAPSTLHWNRLLRSTSVSSSTGGLLDGLDAYDSGMVLGVTVPNYQAALSMAPGSSIWDNYNVMRLDTHHMTLRYDIEGLTSTALGEYSGRIVLGSINTIESLSIDTTDYLASRYTLNVNLHSAMNYLPVDLYYHVTSLKGSRRAINIGLGGSNTVLQLNAKFEYQLNEHDNDIILGVDLLHRFPASEYAVESGELALWYTTESYVNCSRHDTVAIVFTFLLLLVLACYWEFMCSDNARFYLLMIQHSRVTSRVYFFTYRQALVEMATCLLSFIIILISVIFADYNRSQRFQRSVLLWILGVYHFVVLVIVLIITPWVTRKALRYYLRIDPLTWHVVPSELKKGPTPTAILTTTTINMLPLGKEVNMVATSDPDYEQVKEVFIEREEIKLSKELTINVLARNTALLMLIMVDILLILNFSTDVSYLYLLLFFFVSLIFLYFLLYDVALITLYLMVFPRAPRPFSFILFYVGELASVVLFVGWAISCVYLNYFAAINSIYSETFVVAFTLILIALLFILACRGFYSRVDDLIRKIVNK